MVATDISHKSHLIYSWQVRSHLHGCRILDKAVRDIWYITAAHQAIFYILIFFIEYITRGIKTNTIEILIK
jgi:hypothetical protein